MSYKEITEAFAAGRVQVPADTRVGTVVSTRTIDNVNSIANYLELGWLGLWRVASERAQAQVIQFNFVPPHEVALGHLTTRLAGSRHAMILALNARLGQQGEALIVDCDRLAPGVGRQKWSDPRYWYLSRQAVAPEILPLLARNTIAVVATSLGLSKKCLVLDLDNTLWGGMVGEDGLEGIQLGAGPAGEVSWPFRNTSLN